MNQLEVVLRKTVELLGDEKGSWALVGGLAVSIRTEPRFTRDIDIVLTVPDDKTAESVVHRFRISGFRVMATVEQDAVQRLATARLAYTGRRTANLMLDVLFASSGIEQEVCADAEILEAFKGLSIPVATIHHLIALKILARDDRTRPQDAADLRHLLAVADRADLDAARNALRLIEQRGFNRSRRLDDLLSSALREFGED